MHNADEENIALLQEINGLQGHHMQLKQENYPPIVCIKLKEGFNEAVLIILIITSGFLMTF